MDGIERFVEAQQGDYEDALAEISSALLKHRQKSARAILGYPDDLKVCSSMTLFDIVEPNGVFAEVLDVFYGGKRDEKTLELLNT